MKRVTLSTGALAFATLVAVQPSHAVEGPWCAYESLGMAGENSRCDLPNYDACRAWISATPGTWCTQNPRYVAGAQQQRGRTPRRR
jgi:hypothetical protein